MEAEPVGESSPPRALPVTTATAVTASTAPPHLAPLSPASTPGYLPFTLQNIPTEGTDASAALVHQTSTAVDVVQEESVPDQRSSAAMTGEQDGHPSFSGASLQDATPQLGSSFLSELPLDELERAHAADLDASTELAGAAADDAVQQDSTSSFQSYRDTELPDSSFQAGQPQPPSSDAIASPGIPFPSFAQPVQSTPPHPSSSSSSVNPTPVLRAKVPPAKKKTGASTSSAFLSHPQQDLYDDSPDPMRIVPAPSASTTSRHTVVSKMKGKRQAPTSKSAASGDAPTTTTNGDRSSSPRAPALSARGRRSKATDSRLGGATTALDGAEETVGYAGRAGGLEGMGEEEEEEEETGDDMISLKESGEVSSDTGAGGKAKKTSKGSRASSRGSSSVVRPKQAFELDIVVGPSTRRRSTAASPTVERSAPSSSRSAHSASQSQPPSPPSTVRPEDGTIDPTLPSDSPQLPPSAEPAKAEAPQSSSSSPEADSDSRPPSKRGKGKPRRSIPHFDFVVETAKKPTPAPLPAPPVDNPAPHPSSDLTSIADTMLATSPDRDLSKRTRGPPKDAAPSSDGASPKKKRRVPQAALASSSKAEPKETDEGAEDEEAKETTKPDVPVRDTLSRSGVSAEDQLDVFSSPKRRRAAKAPIKDFSSSEDDGSAEEEEEATPKKKARKVVASKAKGKGKAKDVVEKVAKPKPKPRKSVATALPSPPKSALPSPSKMVFGSQPSSSFVQQLAAKAVAPRETPEQRAKGWALGRMDKLVWVHVEKDGVQFWWPGDITNALRSERPLKIALHLDEAKEILAFAPSTEIIIDEPDHTNILSFRTGAKIRFDRELFLDAPDASSDATPSAELFDTILQQVVELEALRGMEDDEEELPSSLPAPKGGALKKNGTKSESEAEEDEPSEEEEEDEEEDELLRDEDESAGFIYPSIVLAKASRQWWGARLLAYKPPAKGVKGKGGKSATGKFLVEWVDGTSSEVKKEDILTSSQAAYFTVKMGTTHLELPADYVDTLVQFTRDLYPTFQRIIDEDFPPATNWSDQFYQGGKSRDALAKKARFGELRDEHTEALQREIVTWASGADGRRRTGSTRYEALSDAERSRYQADILLPLTVFHVIIHEHDFEEQAQEKLAVEGNVLPSEDDIMIRAFALADDEFDRGSIQKAILSARSAKQAADKSRGRRR